MTINEAQIRIFKEAQKDTSLSLEIIAAYWCESGMAKEYREWYESHKEEVDNV
jgi:hypothetical protein